MNERWYQGWLKPGVVDSWGMLILGIAVIVFVVIAIWRFA